MKLLIDSKTSKDFPIKIGWALEDTKVPFIGNGDIMITQLQESGYTNISTHGCYVFSDNSDITHRIHHKLLIDIVNNENEKFTLLTALSYKNN